MQTTGLQIFHSSRPPEIPIGLYHSPWFIAIFHRIALRFISCLVLYCFVVQCTIVCLAFPFLVFWLFNKPVSYHGETVLQGGLVLAKSGRLELGDIFCGHWTL